MPRRLTPLALLSLALTALGAPVSTVGADAECTRPAYVWDLELTRVEALSGNADLQAVARALGTQAVLRGATRDPAQKELSRGLLLGSTDGVGLNVSLEKTQP
ncbi:MAG: hypothetical protein RLZZ450_1085 [Pseudomonadota bacterium]|jgi:hypothetical protein